MLNNLRCERARPGTANDCTVRTAWREGGGQPAATPKMSAQARAWIAGVPWYEECVGHAWAHRATAPGGTAADLMDCVAAVRRCCECLIWSGAD